MDWVWHLLQERDLRQLRERLDRLQHSPDNAWTGREIKELATENIETKLRLDLLIRLLIAKGAISAEEYAALVAATRPGAEQG